MTRYAVGLGSNQGDRLAYLRAGLEGLETLSETDAVVSGVYETAPVGGPDQPSFLNAVVLIDVEMTPTELLAALNDIEGANGRVRNEAWGPRTLDLDIVASEESVDDPPRLVIPHPRAVERRFVLEPLSEIWPEAVVHSQGMLAREALHTVADQVADRLAGPRWEPAASAGTAWVVVQLLWILAIAAVVILQGSRPDWTVWRVVGVVVGAVGMAGLIWSGLTGERHRNGVPRGPYRLARHPLYSSIVLALLGLALLTEVPLAVGLSAILFYFFRLKAEYEENRLRLTDAEYRQYVAKVRWWLFPGLE